MGVFSMEIALLTSLLGSGEYGWLGWLSLLLLAASIMLGVLSKTVLTVIESAKQIKKLTATQPVNYHSQIKSDAGIANILRIIRRDLNADRVLVLQYHNGVRSIANNHLLKVSATHEAIAQNMPAVINDMQSWPSNYLGDWNNEIFDNRYLSVSQNVDFDKSSSLRGICEFLKAQGVRRMYIFPITNAYGAVFGVGLVQQISRDVQLSDDMIKWASQRFHGIGALLSPAVEDED